MRWLVAVTLALAIVGCTKNNNAFKIPEPAFHLEPQVADYELNRRVCRIEMPGILTLTFTHCHLFILLICIR